MKPELESKAKKTLARISNKPFYEHLKTTIDAARNSIIRLREKDEEIAASYIEMNVEKLLAGLDFLDKTKPV